MCPTAVQLHKFRIGFTISVVQSVDSNRILWVASGSACCNSYWWRKHAPFNVRVETTFFTENLSILAPLLYSFFLATFRLHILLLFRMESFVCPTLGYVYVDSVTQRCVGNFSSGIFDDTFRNRIWGIHPIVGKWRMQTDLVTTASLWNIWLCLFESFCA